MELVGFIQRKFWPRCHAIRANPAAQVAPTPRSEPRSLAQPRDCPKLDICRISPPNSRSDLPWPVRYSWPVVPMAAPSSASIWAAPATTIIRAITADYYGGGYYRRGYYRGGNYYHGATSAVADYARGGERFCSLATAVGNFSHAAMPAEFSRARSAAASGGRRRRRRRPEVAVMAVADMTAAGGGPPLTPRCLGTPASVHWPAHEIVSHCRRRRHGRRGPGNPAHAGAAEFPVASLKPLASSRSLGKTVEFAGQDACRSRNCATSAFADVDYALFSAGATRSREFAEACKKAGAVMIDNSSAFRMKADVPLVVPEINAGDLAQAPRHHRGAELLGDHPGRAALAAAPGGGHRAHHRLHLPKRQRRGRAGHGGTRIPGARLRRGPAARSARFSRTRSPSTFSPTTPPSRRTATTRRRTRSSRRRARFSTSPTLPIVATCIRVPVLRAHSESIVIETKRPLSPEEAREILAKAPGVKVVDSRGEKSFPHAARGQRPVRRPRRPHPPGPLAPARPRRSSSAATSCSRARRGTRCRFSKPSSGADRPARPILLKITRRQVVQVLLGLTFFPKLCHI